MSKADLYIMSCGWIKIPAQALIRDRSSDEIIVVPVPVYLIKHPKGNVLIDTGLSSEFIQTSGTTQNDFGLEIQLNKDEYIINQLKKVGLDKSDIKYVINTHLHWDHCGGNKDLTESIMIIQSPEWDSANNPEYIAKKYYVPRLFNQHQNFSLIDGEYDLYDDGSIILVPTYGHTDGHQSIRVKVGDRYLLLTIDTAYLREAFERRILPNIAVDNEETILQSLDYLKQQQDAGDVLFFGHDYQDFIKVSDGSPNKVTEEMLDLLI
ncbi:N-acyl homoserine lactonase family protein [Wohlfahrtiimonas larvae]|uniref:4-pyridoxolactonase n=1 Tax=Wohlfahrtiimonas larvae TaxID=1157986 RepID=A0ABP9MUH5_9GAMM|nr:N-acyl homoserine lactonase family protein [Wohlfahrtiimonas larvae]